VSLAYLETAPLYRVAWWHRLAEDYYSWKAAELSDQQQLEAEIGKAVKMLPGR